MYVVLSHIERVGRLMKKLLLMIIVVCFASILFGCSGDDNKSGSSANSTADGQSETSVAPDPVDEKVSLVKVSDDEVNIREEANTDCEILGYANKGDHYKYTKKSGDFYQVVYNGEKAFISNSFSKVVKVTAAQSKKLLNSGETEEASDTSQTSETDISEATAVASEPESAVSATPEPVKADDIRRNEDPEVKE